MHSDFSSAPATFLLRFLVVAGIEVEAAAAPLSSQRSTTGASFSESSRVRLPLCFVAAMAAAGALATIFLGAVVTGTFEVFLLPFPWLAAKPEEEEEEDDREEEEEREPEAEEDDDPKEEVEDGEPVASTIVMASDFAGLLVSWLALPMFFCASLFCFRMASTLNSLVFFTDTEVGFLHFLLM